MNTRLSFIILAVSLSWLLLGSLNSGMAMKHEADKSKAEKIAKMAMSTASLWMIEHHLHEIKEGIEKGEIGKALEEAEELIPWIKGTSWAHELLPQTHKTTDAVQVVIDKLKKNDTLAAKAAFEELEKSYKHLHHKVMWLVAGGKAAGSHGH